MKKNEKVAFYKELEAEVKGKDFVVFNYGGVNVADLTKMRRKVRENGGSLKIVKNTLLRRFVKDAGLEFDETCLNNMSALATGEEGNFSSVLKVIYDAQREEKVVIKAGLYGQKGADKSYIEKLANIPSREELYAYLVGSLQGVLSNLVYVLESVATQKENK